MSYEPAVAGSPYSRPLDWPACSRPESWPSEGREEGLILRQARITPLNGSRLWALHPASAFLSVWPNAQISQAGEKTPFAASGGHVSNLAASERASSLVSFPARRSWLKSLSFHSLPTGATVSGDRMQ